MNLQFLAIDKSPVSVIRKQYLTSNVTKLHEYSAMQVKTSSVILSHLYKISALSDAQSLDISDKCFAKFHTSKLPITI